MTENGLVEGRYARHDLIEWFDQSLVKSLRVIVIGAVTMSELVDPTVTLEFYEISHRGKKLPEEVRDFSAFLKRYIARWAGEAGIL